MHSLRFIFSYVSRGYHQALRHLKPDMIIFLGDLFDEGFTATDEEYSATVARFRKIFATSFRTLVRIFYQNTPSFSIILILLFSVPLLAWRQ